MTAEVIVTVRMPSSLLTALKKRTAKDHYSGLSEQLRSIIRKGCTRFEDVGSESSDSRDQIHRANSTVDDEGDVGRDSRRGSGRDFGIDSGRSRDEQIEELLDRLRFLMKDGGRP